MSNPTVSIIIPNHNHSHTILACINSIFDTLKNNHFELIVVDDGSTDNSLELLNHIKGIRVIRQERRGIAVAINAGFNEAGTNDVVRIHPETTVETPDWLDKLLEAARTLPKAGIIGTKLLRPDDTVESIGRNILTRIGFRDWYANRQTNQENRDSSAPAQEVDSVPGNLAYYRREAIEAVGGLDENYFPEFLEDDDFCQSARFHGFKIYVLPSITAVNYSTVSQSALLPFFSDTEPHASRLQMQRNNTLHRHYEYWERKWGWHPLHPDLGEIRRLYGHTEICWHIGEPMHYKTPKKLPSVDACMVTWNNLKSLQRALDSLGKTNYPKNLLHVTVVDNASTDGSKEYLDQLVGKYPFKIKPIHLDVNTGAPIALNWAFVQGKADIIAKLDDDVILPPDWLKLVGTFTLRPYAGVVGAKIINDNTLRDIQCGGTGLWPIYDDFQNYTDTGQADYLSLCTHVRGCACLYRREVIKECGLLDLRFSPSQTDDVEHHFRIGAAGYEIVYNGKISISHALGTGTGATRNRASWHNIQANETKLRGKWSDDIHQILEQNIDLSREGRFLPDNGDTSQWTAKGPQPGDYPKKLPSFENISQLINDLNQYEQNDLPKFLNLMQGLVYDHLAAALPLLTSHKRKMEFAQNLIFEALKLMPTSYPAMLSMAAAYIEIGRPSKSLPFLRRAAQCVSKNSEVGKTIQQILEKPDDASLTAQSPNIINLVRQNILYGKDKSLPDGYQMPSSMLSRTRLTSGRTHLTGERTQVQSVPQPNHQLKVLIVKKYGPQYPDEIEEEKFLQAYVKHLDESGIFAEIDDTPRPAVGEFDLIHVWGFATSEKTLQQVKAIRVAAPDIPMVLSPRYGNIIEADWANFIIPRIFSGATNNDQLNGMLQQLAADQLSVSGMLRSSKREPFFPGYFNYLQRIVDMVDYLLPQSQMELSVLKNFLITQKPYSFMPYTVERDDSKVTKNLFIHKYGVRDFVLMIGAVRTQENQIMLLNAMEHTNLPVVIIGNSYQDETEYKRLCRKFTTDNTIFIEDLPQDLLHSAYQAARIFAMPAWKETTLLPALQAALSGCALVLSDRTSGVEYFHNYAYYCDPANITSISQAVSDANQNYEAEKPNRDQLIKHISHTYNWQNSIQRVKIAYRDTMLARGRSLPPILQSERDKVKPHTIIVPHKELQPKEKRDSAVGTSSKAEKTLEMLLNANDLEKSLVANEYLLDSELLDLVLSNARASRQEGKIDLADGLSTLAEYIQNAISHRALSGTTKAGTPDVDIVIPIYGQARLVQQCVESLFKTTQVGHVFLVDDCSPGTEIQRLLSQWKNHPHITLAKTPANQGFIGACKLGASLGSAPFILFLNSDTRAMDPGWLEKLLPKDEDIGIVGAKLLYPTEIPGPLAGAIQHAGVARDENGIPYHPFIGRPANTPEANQERAVNAVTGACFLIRRSLWIELGGWDEQFGLGVYEDVDLCWRARQKGYRVIYQPDAMLYHYESASKSPDGHHLLNEHTRNNLQKLLNRWQPITSDEALFFGEENVKRWQQARNQVKPILQLIEAGQLPSGGIPEFRRIVERNQDMPDLLVTYANLLSAQGNHRAAADNLAAALKFAPAYWNVRIKLIEELIASNQPQKAAQELIPVLAVFPGSVEVKNFREILSPYLEQTTADVTPLNEIRAQPVAEIFRPHLTPSQVLEKILNADDLPSELIQSESQLDEDVLKLVQSNAVSARQEGTFTLAEGLDNLALYIQQVIANRMTGAKPVPTLLDSLKPHIVDRSKAQNKLEMLLNSDDLVSALKQHEDWLDQDLLEIVKTSAKKNRADGITELADGLDYLVSYIEQILIIRHHQSTLESNQRSDQIKGTASQTLEMLLNSDDLGAALKEHEDLLDENLLELVKENARDASLSGKSDLANGLDILVDYIQQVILQKN